MNKAAIELELLINKLYAVYLDFVEISLDMYARGIISKAILISNLLNISKIYETHQ